MSIQASPASSFEFKDLAYQVHSEMKQGTEIAPSIDELIARVESVRAWVDSGQLDREQKEIAVRWLDMVAARTQLSEDIRGRMLNLRTILMRQVLTPEQIEARVMREFQIDASNPKKFDEFIEAYITSRPLMTQEKAIMEFHRVWESMIAQQGYIVKVEQGFLIIYNKEGNLDRQRTASIAKLPDAVSIYQKQMTFLRAMQDTTSKSAKERAMSMVNLYNKQAGNKKIPPLTDRIIADEGSKNAYITEVSNS